MNTVYVFVDACIISNLKLRETFNACMNLNLNLKHIHIRIGYNI